MRIQINSPIFTIADVTEYSLWLYNKAADFEAFAVTNRVGTIDGLPTGVYYEIRKDLPKNKRVYEPKYRVPDPGFVVVGDEKQNTLNWAEHGFQCKDHPNPTNIHDV